MAGTVALIVAAGRGSRFGGAGPKQYAPLGGRPLLRYCLERFRGHPGISSVQAVIHADDHALYAEATAGLDLPPPAIGGTTRQESVRRGLEHIAGQVPERVLIHDAARPFVDDGMIDRVLAALTSAPGAIAALAVTDTLKRGIDGRVGGTVPRDGLWRAQTPQGFRFAEILAAHRASAGAEMTDDAAVAERAGLAVALVEGAAENVKITTSEDLIRAERWLAAHQDETRVGTGFDVHRFAPGDHVMLCGVRVAHDAGLLGHSDADVGLHALTDAILGAIAAGDIGSHFPPGDDRWRGAESTVFLRHAAALVAARGGRIAHVDVTLICERPKVGPHRAAMTTRIAQVLKIDSQRVSIKATTTEGLGFTGRGEGIAAQATATIRLPAVAS
jgi:2-C-methyl-D-erythritol 4-phosphate cytidylyltransferase / 2-C-methyl-D-erythritol 2,4-cyclodiphosphate synthase